MGQDGGIMQVIWGGVKFNSEKQNDLPAGGRAGQASQTIWGEAGDGPVPKLR